MDSAGWLNSNLIAAIEDLDVDRLRELVAAGADPNGRDDLGRPHLYRAIDVERAPTKKESALTSNVIEALLDAGADPRLEWNGETALEFAERLGQSGARALILSRMEQGASTTIRRPFHWGIVFLVAEESKGDIPEPPSDGMVSGNSSGISVFVRHAQDTDEVEDEYLKFAEVEIGFRLLDAPSVDTKDRREVFCGTIDLPSGRLNVGDADGETIVKAHRGLNTIVVSVDADVPPDEITPDAVWIDLLPAEAASSRVTFADAD